MMSPWVRQLPKPIQSCPINILTLKPFLFRLYNTKQNRGTQDYFSDHKFIQHKILPPTLLRWLTTSMTKYWNSVTDPALPWLSCWHQGAWCSVCRCVSASPLVSLTGCLPSRPLGLGLPVSGWLRRKAAGTILRGKWRESWRYWIPSLVRYQ